MRATRASGTNPRALGTNPRAQRTDDEPTPTAPRSPAHRIIDVNADTPPRPPREVVEHHLAKARAALRNGARA